MAETIVRRGLLGLAMEATPGVAAGSPEIFVPWTDNKLKIRHEPIIDIAARGSRIGQYGAVIGKNWGEGDVTMYLDSLNVAYLLKLVLGQETVTLQNTTPPVYDHLMTPTVSGNIPQTATLWDYKGVDWQQFVYAAVDTLEITIKNSGFIETKATFMAKPPVTTTAPAQTTTSGTLFAWKDATIAFGSTVQLAQSASPTKLTEFHCKITNALKLTYKTGNSAPDTIVLGMVKVDGDFTMYFESATQRDNYKNLITQSMFVTVTGASLGAGFNEQVYLSFKKVVFTAIDYTTGIEDLYALKFNFEALWDQNQAGYLDVTFRNGKSSAYT